MFNASGNLRNGVIKLQVSIWTAPKLIQASRATA
jgi:hypothetical protein